MGNYNLITSITKEAYAEIVSSLTDKFQQHLKHVLAEARCAADAVDRIIFDGGMLDLPLIHRSATAFVPAAQVKTLGLSYHQVQAQNATACAAIFQGNSNKATDNAHQGDVQR